MYYYRRISFNIRAKEGGGGGGGGWDCLPQPPPPSPSLSMRLIWPHYTERHVFPVGWKRKFKSDHIPPPFRLFE